MKSSASELGLINFLSLKKGGRTIKEGEGGLLEVSAPANFAHFCIIFSGYFMDNIYMSLH